MKVPAGLTKDVMGPAVLAGIRREESRGVTTEPGASEDAAPGRLPKNAASSEERECSTSLCQDEGAQR